MSKTPPTPAFGQDPKPYFLAIGVLIALEFIRRLFLGYVPDDFTAYLSAADTFAAGGNPYSDDILTQPRYNHKPFNYLPGTLWFLWPLHLFSTSVAAAFDWCLRILALGFAIFEIRRAAESHGTHKLPLHFTFLLAVAFQPLLVDLLFGNIITYLLFALALILRLSRTSRQAPRILGGLAAGLILAFKPYWVLPGLFIAVAKRSFALAASVSAGAALVVFASLPFWSWKDIYISHVQAMAAFYYSVAIQTLVPFWMVLVVIVAWCVAGGFLIRKNPEESWLFAFTSLVCFPRVGTYDYVLAFPLVLLLITRLGWLRGLMLGVVFWGPLPWILRTIKVEGLPTFVFEAWTHWLWMWAACIWVFALIWRGRTA